MENEKVQDMQYKAIEDIIYNKRREKCEENAKKPSQFYEELAEI